MQDTDKRDKETQKSKANLKYMLHVRQLELESNVTWSIKTAASKLTIGFTRNLHKIV